MLVVKFDEKYNEAHTDLIRHHGMSPVVASAELHHVYRTWNPHTAELRISIELLFIRVRGSAMKHKMTSSDITAYPPLQPAQSCITFIALRSSHAAAHHSGRQGPVRCTTPIAFTSGILPGLLFDVHEGAYGREEAVTAIS